MYDKRDSLKSDPNHPDPSFSFYDAHPKVEEDHFMDPIESTNLEAVHCKLSAVQAGYMTDLYISKLMRWQHSEKKLPLMNRGK